MWHAVLLLQSLNVTHGEVGGMRRYCIASSREKTPHVTQQTMQQMFCYLLEIICMQGAKMRNKFARSIIFEKHEEGVDLCYKGPYYKPVCFCAFALPLSVLYACAFHPRSIPPMSSNPLLITFDTCII